MRKAYKENLELLIRRVKSFGNSLLRFAFFLIPFYINYMQKDYFNFKWDILRRERNKHLTDF